MLQRSVEETRAAVEELEAATVHGSPVVARVSGVPAQSAPAWLPTWQAVDWLTTADVAAQFSRPLPSRKEIALSYARARGRISTTELASIVGADPTNVGSVLKSLERESLLAPGRENRRGPGFFYVAAGSD